MYGVPDGGKAAASGRCLPCGVGTLAASGGLLVGQARVCNIRPDMLARGSGVIDEGAGAHGRGSWQLLRVLCPGRRLTVVLARSTQSSGSTPSLDSHSPTLGVCEDA